MLREGLKNIIIFLEFSWNPNKQYNVYMYPADQPHSSPKHLRCKTNSISLTACVPVCRTLQFVEQSKQIKFHENNYLFV